VNADDKVLASPNIDTANDQHTQVGLLYLIYTHVVNTTFIMHPFRCVCVGGGGAWPCPRKSLWDSCCIWIV